MSGKPDWKPERQPKKSRRRKAPLVVKQATLADRECWVCGEDGANGHHLIPKDFTLPGPDEPWNIVSLCGSGTMGCHGAFHGNPYTTEHGQRITPTIARARILARLLKDRPRLREVWDYLGGSELRELFFVRLLGMHHRDLYEMERRNL